MNLTKIYEIYEYFHSSEARFHILLEARRAETERGPKGLSEAWRTPEAEDSAGGTPAAGADFGKRVFLGQFSIHLSIKNSIIQYR